MTTASEPTSMLSRRTIVATVVVAALIIGAAVVGYALRPSGSPQLDGSALPEGTPPTRPAQPPAAITDNGQVRLFSVRGTVDAVDNARVVIRIPQRTQNENGVFIDFLRRELRFNATSEFVRARLEPTSPNGIAFSAATSRDIRPGAEVEVYSTSDIMQYETTLLARLVLAF